MVESLLQHNITNVNVREALKISWELKLDSIAGLLLECIATDRTRDSVNLSGLELTTVKPLWILPSLGLKNLPEAKLRKRHHKQQSLGHVKDFLVRRKSSGNLDLELSYADSNTREQRRMSVDFRSLKYVSDLDPSSLIEDTDFGGNSEMMGGELAATPTLSHGKMSLLLDADNANGGGQRGNSSKEQTHS